MPLHLASKGREVGGLTTGRDRTNKNTLKEGTTIPATAEVETSFAHINLNEIDAERGKRKFEALETADYTLEINSFEKSTVKPAKGKRAGIETEVVKGSFTVMNNPQYPGRKLWHTFWPGGVTAKMFHCISRATGVPQEEGEDIYAWLEQFGKMFPPATFNVHVEKQAPYNNPEGDPVNEIKFFTAKPSA